MTVNSDKLRPTRINVTLGKEFTISLESNPTTGYSWEAEFDKNYLELENEIFTSFSPGSMGGGGEDVFTFLPIKTGKTKVEMVYKRPWEKETVKKEIFPVKIGDRS